MYTIYAYIYIHTYYIIDMYNAMFPATEFVKWKVTTILGGFYLLSMSWKSHKFNTSCTDNICCWVKTGWVMLLA